MSYIIKQGDSLYLIAKRFGTTVESIMKLNNMKNSNINIGQSIIIPQYSEAIVKLDQTPIKTGMGDNYNTIAKMSKGARLPVIATDPKWFKVRIFNGKEGYVARKLVNFYTYGGDKPIVAMAGFYTLEEGAALPSSFKSFVENTSQLSEVPLFLFRFNRYNPANIEKFGIFSDQDVKNLVAIGHRYNVKMLAVVHNLLYKPGGQAAGKEVAKLLLATQQSRNSAISNIIALIDKYQLDGVNIDIEDVYMEDSGRLSAFYVELGRALRKKGYFYSVSIPSRITDKPINPFSDPFDYALIGAVVDQFIAMLYNEHGWPGSGPGPVVSSGWMKKVVNYAKTKMPKDKIMAAISVFGFDFNLKTGRAAYITHAGSVKLANQYGSQIIFDEATQTPMFSYTAANGDKHEVWFEDQRSIISKINIASDLGISGVALWRLGLEDPDLWIQMKKDIIVKKL